MDIALMFWAMQSLEKAKSRQLQPEAMYRLNIEPQLGICEGMWIQWLLEELRIETQSSFKMLSDGQATIGIAKNLIHHDITKYTEMD